MKPYCAVLEEYKPEDGGNLFYFMLGLDLKKDGGQLTAELVKFCIEEIISQHPQFEKQVQEIKCGSCENWFKENRDKTISIQAIDPEKVKEVFEKRDSGITIIEVDIFSLPGGLGIGIIR